MKNNIFSFLTVAMATVSLFFISCEDDVSSIGNSISQSEVTINVDSVIYKLAAASVPAPALESKAAYTLLGSVSVPQYGNLNCSYVTQFLPAEKLNIPDSITSKDVDSVKMILSIPKNLITGDSIAPQQLKVYTLTKQLPSDISASFNPEGYYDPSSPIGVKNFNLTGETFSDSAFVASPTVRVHVNLPKSIGQNTFDAYRQDPEMFIWPQRFAEFWPGVYIESTFGKGCIAAVASTRVFAYYPKKIVTTEKDENGETQSVTKFVADSVCMFSTAPEVISSVNIDYHPASSLEDMVNSGKSIITTPGGFVTKITFPAREILENYWDAKYDLGVINNLVFSIPAKEISNRYGIGVPPALLMVKESDLDSFFEDGKLPDNKTSFYSLYSSESRKYVFSSMRQYIVDLKAKGEANITDEDINFVLFPVVISTEDYTDNLTGNLVTTVTDVMPYIVKPSMVELDTENASVVFTYSNQTIY